MAGEVLLINPRRRRARRRKSKVRARRPARRRRLFAAANPRRRRRVGARARRRIGARRRRHSNPRARQLFGGSFMGVNIGQAVAGGIGFVGANLAAGQLLKALSPVDKPATWMADPNTANLVRIGLKAGVTIGGVMLLRRSPLKGFANAWAVGGGVATVVDALTTYLLPALGLADYESGMLNAYSEGQLYGYPPESNLSGDFGPAYGANVYS